MKVAVVQFPGSNCDQDALYALRDEVKVDAEYVWYQSDSLSGYDAVVLPGGFSYGDYLRGGAIASLSPIMEEVKRFANEGKPVLGICNGFQVLTESGILPGALVRNIQQKFICKWVHIKCMAENSCWALEKNRVLSMPIAHNEGRYTADEQTLKQLHEERRVAFVYCGENGELNDTYNPNGSTNMIAGITNERGNVLGMMPHPERACNPILGGVDGRSILERLVN